MERIVIHTSDICRITGYSPKWAQLLLRRIRTSTGKTQRGLVTFDEFYQHTGLPRPTGPKH